MAIRQQTDIDKKLQITRKTHAVLAGCQTEGTLKKVTHLGVGLSKKKEVNFEDQSIDIVYVKC